MFSHKANSPSFDSPCKISMALQKLSQRYGRMYKDHLRTSALQLFLGTWLNVQTKRCSVEIWQDCVGQRQEVPSAVPEKPSTLKLLVLFFLLCFLRLAWGDGGGSIFGLVVLDMLGLEHTESPTLVSAHTERETDVQAYFTTH